MIQLKKLGRQWLLLTGVAALTATSLNAQQGVNHYTPVSTHQSIESGIVWKDGQMLPHFATPVSRLDGFDMKQAQLKAEEKNMLLALQGIVNRRQPRIFLFEHGSEGKYKWPRLLNLTIDELAAGEHLQLVAKYKDEIKGVILYNPEKSEHYYNLASIYFEQGDEEKAIDFLEKTLELNPKDNEASIVFAKIMAKHNNLVESTEILIDAIHQNPYDANLHYTLARLQKEAGNQDEYIAELKEALNNSDTLSFEPRLLENEIKLAEQS